jgi:hypothetical protein
LVLQVGPSTQYAPPSITGQRTAGLFGSFSEVEGEGDCSPYVALLLYIGIAANSGSSVYFGIRAPTPDVNDVITRVPQTKYIQDITPIL